MCYIFVTQPALFCHVININIIPIVGLSVVVSLLTEMGSGGRRTAVSVKASFNPTLLVTS